MKKETQRVINRGVKIIYCFALDELRGAYGDNYTYDAPHSKLRSCQAWVYETENFYLLRSYDTIVAVISKTTNTLYDALRLVYEYNEASAQHIAKFRTDYGFPYTSRYISV